MMDQIFAGIGNMIMIVVLACVIVLLAMIIDLCSGLYKAGQRGEIKSSWGLKRSLNKFIMYEGGMMIAAGVDMLIHFSKILHLMHMDVIYDVPVITCLLGIFLLAVEFLSVREKADEKTKTEFARTALLAATMVNKNELVEALTQAIIESRKNGGKHENSD